MLPNHITLFCCRHGLLCSWLSVMRWSVSLWHICHLEFMMQVVTVVARLLWLVSVSQSHQSACIKVSPLRNTKRHSVPLADAPTKVCHFSPGASALTLVFRITARLSSHVSAPNSCFAEVYYLTPSMSSGHGHVLQGRQCMHVTTLYAVLYYPFTFVHSLHDFVHDEILIFLIVCNTIGWATNMWLQAATTQIIGGKWSNHAAAGPGPMETADQADTPPHLGMANPPLQPGAPDNLAVHSGALDKPGTVQVRLLTCKADAVIICRCNACRLQVCM